MSNFTFVGHIAKVYSINWSKYGFTVLFLYSSNHLSRILRRNEHWKIYFGGCYKIILRWKYFREAKYFLPKISIGPGGIFCKSIFYDVSILNKLLMLVRFYWEQKIENHDLYFHSLWMQRNLNFPMVNKYSTFLHRKECNIGSSTLFYQLIEKNKNFC